MGGYSKLQAHSKQHKKPDKLQKIVNVCIGNQNSNLPSHIFLDFLPIMHLNPISTHPYPNTWHACMLPSSHHIFQSSKLMKNYKLQENSLRTHKQLNIQEKSSRLEFIPLFFSVFLDLSPRSQ